MNKVDDAESSRPHTFTLDSSGVLTNTWQVISRVSGITPVTVLLETVGGCEALDKLL